MPLPDLTALETVAKHLDQLRLPYAFTGGAIASLLLDEPELSFPRNTDDVDVILSVLASSRYSDIEEQLRGLRFDHDMTPGAPLCRWLLEGITVDIMPVDGSHLGLNTQWFAEALADASEHVIGGVRLRLVSPPAFIATKLSAFADRGKKDYYSSHDLEDLLTVIDGRNHIVSEMAVAPLELRRYVAGFLDDLTKNDVFQDALQGHLPGDALSQARLPQLRQKLADIARLI